MADTVGLRPLGRAAAHRRAGRPRPARRRSRRRATRACGSTRRPRPRKIAAIGVQADPGPVDARLRPQRRPRPGLLRPHRPLRHHRQGRHVAARPRASTSRCARSSTRSSPRARRGWGGPVARARQDVVWRHRARRPEPRSAGARARRADSARQAGDPSGCGPSRAAAAAGWPRPASTGGLPIAERKPEWLRVPAAPRPGVPAPRSARCATSTWSRCARRRAARTSPSAGPTAPPRS